MSNVYNGLEIAVIGMSGRFPGAENINEYWDNLIRGKESVSFVDREELVTDPAYKELVNNPNYVNSLGGVLQGKDKFDASFFEYTPLEAEIMDPQIRILHEEVYHCLEDAGYKSYNCKTDIGLYVGASPGFLWEANMLLSAKSESLGMFNSFLLADKDFIATRIAQKLNLTGPAISLFTACSTSLVAIHLASQAILNGECEMALAGGVKINHGKEIGYIYQEGMINSPDGHCRAFDEKAKGTIPGEGGGVVLLKRLEDAIADNDNIHAVIKGSAINNDGNRKIGYTAPSVDGQVKVIKMAQVVAGVDAETIQYVETHGTGTELGDPIEIEALNQVFNSNKNSCAIGSVKTNIGHLDSGAGIAGFIKSVLITKHRQIPPSLNFTNPNPKIDFQKSPFFVNTKLLDLSDSITPVRVAVSSFGIGGTNAHIIIEEAPKIQSYLQLKPKIDDHVLLISAKTKYSMENSINNIHAFIDKNRHFDLGDVSYTLSEGRNEFNLRKALVGSDHQEVIAKLKKSRKYKTINQEENKEVVFLFSGQGSQYLQMGAGLIKDYPQINKNLLECLDCIKQIDGSIYEQIFHFFYGNNVRQKMIEINNTILTQPLLFVLQYSIAYFLIRQGVKPCIMIGYGCGEYISACISGVISLSDAIKMILIRSKLMQTVEKGSMVSVSSELKELHTYIGDELSIAAKIGGGDIVVSGRDVHIENFLKQISGKGISFKRLNVSHAFHSKMMECIREEYKKAIQIIKFKEPKIPYISNITGQPITDEQIFNYSYWSDHLVRCVDFEASLHYLKNLSNPLFVEIGPGDTLSSSIKSNRDFKDSTQVNLIRNQNELVTDKRQLLDALCKLWENGLTIDWQKWIKRSNAKCISLPLYPFDKRKFEFENNLDKKLKSNLKNTQSFQKNPNLENWIFLPSWHRIQIVENKRKIQFQKILVFTKNTSLENALMDKLSEENNQLIRVNISNEYSSNLNNYFIDPEDPEHYFQLFKELNNKDSLPSLIIHCWDIKLQNRKQELSAEYISESLITGYYSLLNIANAIAKYHINQNVEIQIVTNNINLVNGDEKCVYPEKATLTGPVKVIPQEFRNINCRLIEFCLNDIISKLDVVVSQIARVINSKSNEIHIALRKNYYWSKQFIPFKQNIKLKEETCFRKEKVYLIFGGTGGIGLEMARYISKLTKSTLILVGKTSFPNESNWSNILSQAGESDTLRRKIESIIEIKKYGSDVEVFAIDVSCETEMSNFYGKISKKYGKVHGVIHSAGIADGMLIQGRRKNDSQKVFASKILGAINVSQFFGNKNLDFLIFNSSLSSVISPLGQVAYASANAFLDAFAEYLNPYSERKIISINWDAWQKVGMAENSLKKYQGEDNSIRDELEYGILPFEGVEVFKSVITNNFSQVLISTRDFNCLLSRYFENMKVVVANSGKKEIVEGQNSSMKVKGFIPEKELQDQLCVLYKDIFGYESFGVNDNFFEMGGNSLLAINLASKVNKQLGKNITFLDILEFPTIIELSEMLNDLNLVFEESFDNKDNNNEIII